jgi:cytoskeleton protein RodZ
MAEPLRLDAVEAPAAPPTPSVATAIAPASAIDPSLSAAQPSASLQAPGLTPSVALSSTGALNFTARASSWIEVKDASGARLFSRLVKSGENISLNGSLPLQVRIGNVASVQMRFKGQPVDLSAYSRNNVARIELK